jgi:glycosyltransferase involved in cell wall biosynthesis
MNELISIVMPVKNAGLYLKDCLESILAQTYPNWELLAVDDGSTDSSLEILQYYSQKYPRIHTFKNSGNGIILALRTAYSHSNGEYIHRMDADDLMAPRKLELMLAELKQAGKGTVVTALVQYFAEGGVSDGYLKYEKWLNALCENDRHWEEVYQECVIASPCWLIHRQDLDAVGVFDEDRYPEDYDLVFRFYEKGLKVKSVKEVLHYWRDHSARSSRNHEHYQANSFFALKLHYFLKLERDPKRSLVVWGAGPKGKRLAKMLNRQGIDFEWVSNNPNKHGKEIYEQIMRSFKKILEFKRPQVIITVAQRKAKQEIVDFLESNGLEVKEDYWFFR